MTREGNGTLLGEHVFLSAEEYQMVEDRITQDHESMEREQNAMELDDWENMDLVDTEEEHWNTAKRRRMQAKLERLARQEELHHDQMMAREEQELRRNKQQAEATAQQASHGENALLEVAMDAELGVTVATVRGFFDTRRRVPPFPPLSLFFFFPFDCWVEGEGG
jgi:hypothetical protein